MAEPFGYEHVPRSTNHSGLERSISAMLGPPREGEASSVPAIDLPRRVINAHVILPYFSPGGNYLVAVTTDRDGSSDKATGLAVANVQGFHADLTVTLDLRRLTQGTYFLATTHEGDPASYFYPLSVK